MMLGEFYQVLTHLLDLQMGKILLALSKPSELKTLLSEDSPFLSRYSQQLTSCLSGMNCSGVKTLSTQLVSNIIFFL